MSRFFLLGFIFDLLCFFSVKEKVLRSGWEEIVADRDELLANDSPTWTGACRVPERTSGRWGRWAVV